MRKMIVVATLGMLAGCTNSPPPGRTEVVVPADTKRKGIDIDVNAPGVKIDIEKKPGGKADVDINVKPRKDN